MIYVIIFPAILLVLILIWWRFFYFAQPAFSPLPIADDDPLMREAMSRAKDSIADFRSLAEQPNHGIRVKVPFVTSSGATEYPWKAGT